MRAAWKDVLIDVLGFVLVIAICACCQARDDLVFVFIDALVLLLLVQVLCYVLVEALVCSPVKQVFSL